MKHTVLIVLIAASAVIASAQTPAKPASSPATPATSSTTAGKPASTTVAAKPAAPISPAIAPLIKAPAGVPPVKGIQKPIFTIALRYQEIKAGTGAVAETGKLYKVLYTGYRASDGVVFDSSEKHRQPLKDKDGKPVMGDDGKPKLADAQPMPFIQGVGGTIPGFDQGFAGMKVGGKRRLFIPWQLAYGTRNIPDHGPDHPGIPAKSDLIFDVELVDVSEPPAAPAHPPMGAMPGRPMPPRPGTPGAPPASGQPGAAPSASQPAAPSTPATTSTPAAPPVPATQTPPTQPPSK
jgi:peptidylprolyl isomerase